MPSQSDQGLLCLSQGSSRPQRLKQLPRSALLESSRDSLENEEGVKKPELKKDEADLIDRHRMAWPTQYKPDRERLPTWVLLCSSSPSPSSRMLPPVNKKGTSHQAHHTAPPAPIQNPISSTMVLNLVLSLLTKCSAIMYTLGPSQTLMKRHAQDQ